MAPIDDLVRPQEYPRTSGYDPGWLLGLDMGPHPLWLLEDLSQDLDLRAGMRVLDLGSGKGATSVFLAREFGVEVWAADLWVSPDDVAQVVAEQGVADRVHPLRADANDLPFAREWFDAIVSIDAFEYFGTGDHYLSTLCRFLVPDGQLAVATPALTSDVRDLGEVPAHIAALVGWEAVAWHTAGWWRSHWDITGLVQTTSARSQPSGWHDWLLWAKACRERGHDPAQATIDMLEADAGRFITFAMLVARNRPSRGPGPGAVTAGER